MSEESTDSDDEDNDDDGSTSVTSFPSESFRVVVLLPPRCREGASLQTSSAADGANTGVHLGSGVRSQRGGRRGAGRRRTRKSSGDPVGGVEGGSYPGRSGLFAATSTRTLGDGEPISFANTSRPRPNAPASLTARQSARVRRRLTVLESWRTV